MKPVWYRDQKQNRQIRHLLRPGVVADGILLSIDMTT